MENNEKLKQTAKELKKGLELLSRNRKVVLPHNKAFDLVDEDKSGQLDAEEIS